MYTMVFLYFIFIFKNFYKNPRTLLFIIIGQNDALVYLYINILYSNMFKFSITLKLKRCEDSSSAPQNSFFYI